jgi:hypothetical protein
MHDLPSIPAVVGMAQAEAQAMNALAKFLTSEEGRQASDDDLKLWLVDRGWPASKLRAWTERISAYLSLSEPDAADPRVLAARLSTRLERLAHRAEDLNDMKHAIEATKAQAQLGKVGGFAPVAQQQVQVTITNANAHLVSDEELLRVAGAKQVDAISVATEVEDPLLA